MQSAFEHFGCDAAVMHEYQKVDNLLKGRLDAHRQQCKLRKCKYTKPNPAIRQLVALELAMRKVLDSHHYMSDFLPFVLERKLKEKQYNKFRSTVNEFLKWPMWCCREVGGEFEEDVAYRFDRLKATKQFVDRLLISDDHKQKMKEKAPHCLRHLDCMPFTSIGIMLSLVLQDECPAASDNAKRAAEALKAIGCEVQPDTILRQQRVLKERMELEEAPGVLGKRTRDEDAEERTHPRDSAARCAFEGCTICDGSEWKRMCAGEETQVTEAVKKANLAMATEMLGKPAVALDPETDDELRGQATEVRILPCGDPLFKFSVGEDKVVWVHEMELVE